MKYLDYDPEDEGAPIDDEDSSEDDEVEQRAGREHYESVGKSKLRKPQDPSLGAKYQGVAVSRETLEEDDYDPFAPTEETEDEDPFANHAGSNKNGDDSDEYEEAPHKFSPEIDGEAPFVDEEIDSDEAFDEDDVQKFKSFKFRGSKSQSRDENDSLGDHINPSISLSHNEADEVDEESEDEHDSEAEEDNDASDNSQSALDDRSGDSEDIRISSSEDSDENDVSNHSGPSDPVVSKDRKALRALALDDTKSLASSLSAAAVSDANKGRAVRKQRTTFDRLLDTRIKLQKGLSSANIISAGSLAEQEVQEAVQKAEAAAVSLWSTIESIRQEILNVRDQGSAESSSTKRKRSEPLRPQTSTLDLWSRSEELESSALPYRRAVLDKWSMKTRSAINTAPRSKLLDSQQQVEQNKLTNVLDAYLAMESEKLITASTSDTNTATQISPIYDDNSFYQTLLREFINSRSNSSNDQNGIYIPPITKLHTSGSKSKKVDTKASKGRKVRYTVHEKLQNFMAAEDRTTWVESARAEFFASLLGQSKVLEENMENLDVTEMNGGEDEDDGEVEALRLFRS